MSPLDATPQQKSNCTASADPVWIQQIVEFLRSSIAIVEQYEHVQFVFDRAGNQVRADYSIKSIKLR